MTTLDLSPADSFEDALARDDNSRASVLARVCNHSLGAFVQDYSPSRVWKRAMRYNMSEHDLIVTVQRDPSFATEA